MKMKRVQLLIDEELLLRIDAQAKKENTNRSELIRHAAEKLLSEAGASEGVDTVLKLVRKAIQDELNPQVNRLAKMTAKSIKASATTMYMNLIEMGEKGNMDAISVFRDAEAKAVTYLTTKD